MFSSNEKSLPIRRMASKELTTPVRPLYTSISITTKGTAMQKKKMVLAFLAFFVLLTSLGLSGCANQQKSEAGALLTQDYRKMDNDELLLYYYRLTEEIDRTERSGSGSAVSVGIGGGRWGWGGGGGSGVGVGVSTTTPVGGGGGTDDLRNRRAEVRAEMQKRNMKLP
jgi:hypothetical protein